MRFSTLNVVAEGVETEEQAALLLELDCDEMQGYLISRPVPPGKVVELIRSQENQKAGAPHEKASATGGKSKGSKNSKKRR
jgi:sensor c-di-GMP phosphodiesterase-like protein